MTTMHCSFQQSLHQLMTDFRHCFGIKTSLPVTKSAPALSHDTMRLF